MKELARVARLTMAAVLMVIGAAFWAMESSPAAARTVVATGDPLSSDGTTSGGVQPMAMVVPFNRHEAQFGYAVAIDGDTMVIGARLENGDAASTIASPNTNASGAGAVYVYVRDGAEWKLQAYLKPSNIEANDRFGESVAIDGDTIVVGAIGEDGSITSTTASSNNFASGSGAAYVFVRSGTAWSQQGYLKASDAQADDLFGQSVDVSGDTIVVGAQSSEPITAATQSANNGSAYVFTRSGSDWTEAISLTSPLANSVGDRMGFDVAIDGDTIAVSAYLEDGSASSTLATPDRGALQAGAVYVYTGSGSTWTLQQYLKASNAEAADKFGYSLALDGDRLVVGVRNEGGSITSTAASPNNDAQWAGAVYVFERSAGTWTQQAYVKAPNAGIYDFFGTDVALDGDLLAVSASAEDGTITSTLSASNNFGSTEPDNASHGVGAVYVFEKVSGVWAAKSMLKSPNSYTRIINNSEIGYSVGIAGSTVVASTVDESERLMACNIDDSLKTGVAYAYVLGAGDARLSNLELSSGTAVTSTRDGRGFVPYNGCYAATVAHERTMVTPTTAAAGATTTATVSLPSGDGAQACPNMVCPLEMGANLITVTVTSTDGLASRWYQMLTTRTVSSDADLTGLGASVGEVAQHTSTAYTITVPAGTTSATLTPTKSHSAATAVASAPCSGLVCALSTFPTVVTLTVTAEDAATTKYYVVTFMQGAVRQQVSLSDLTVAPGTLAPTFASTTTAYVVDLEEASVVTLTGTPAPTTATVTYSSTEGACTAGACPVAATGTTLLTVTVTSQDGTVSKEYVVGVVQRTGVYRADVAKLGHGPFAGHFCVTTNADEVLCWGANFNGQLGLGFTDTVGVSTPVKMPGMSDASDVAMGSQFTCVLRKSGQVQCTGIDDVWQLGNGALGESSTLTDVLSPDGGGVLTGVTHLSAGNQAACAVIGGPAGGPVLCWGKLYAFYNGSGMTDVGSSLPSEVPGLTDATMVGVGEKTACALRTNGTVQCWGSNYNKMFGVGSSSPATATVPVTVLNVLGTDPLQNVEKIRVGGTHACAVLSGGDYYCWGDNYYYQMANGTQTDSGLPTTSTLTDTLAPLAEIARSGPGEFHSCALTQAGLVYCSGENGEGSVGAGHAAYQSRATAVTRYPHGPALSGQVDIGAISDATCTLSESGSVYCWGEASYGRLGIGETTHQYNPVKVIKRSSTDARLSGLAIDPGTLTPSFVSSTTDYAATAPNGTTSAVVTATTSDVNATMTYSSSAGACDGSNCDVAAPKTWITVTVTAEDGTTKEEYVVEITVADANASSDASLSGLTIAPGTLTPAFVSGTTEYAATVPNGTTSAVVTATVNDVSATVAYASSAGTCAPSDASPSDCEIAASGTTTITVTVTAANGDTQGYVIVVTVADANASDDASLSDLTIAPGTLAPTFVSSTNDYEVGVPNGTTSVAVTATTSDANATVTYASSAGACDAPPGMRGVVVPAWSCVVAAPKTWITVTVTAEDGLVTDEYSIEITVAAALTTIDRVWPGTGLPEGGMPVQIFGSGFVAALTVTVGPYDGGMITVPFEIENDARIRFVMPEGVAGQSVSVTVQTNDDSQTAANAFTYVAPQVIEFSGLEGGVFTTTDGVVVEIPSQGVDGNFVITMTPLPPEPGVPGNVLMYSFRLDALLNWVPLASLTNPVTIKLPIDENIFAIADGERPWLYQWVDGSDSDRYSGKSTTNTITIHSASVGFWTLVRGQAYDPGTQVMTVALRPMGVYALSTAYLRAYWFPVVPVVK